jgi:Tol biopolymer transport system component
VTNLGPESPDAGFSISPGDRLGPYEIVGPLGAGGMGEVYRARDPRLRRDVAVKVLRRSLSLTPEHAERLAREARAAGSLNHPNIVAVFDVGREGSLPYVVSELLEGESLRSRLARGPLPYRKALEYGIQIAEALGAAHEKGIWHRDVKPGNAFITTDSRVKLLDFGLVKLKARPAVVGSQDPTVDDTKAGGIHGTLGYMSPEQLLGESVDHRTDLFALGAVLYEMLAGVPAFRRASATETTRAVLSEDPVDLLERNHSLPPAVVAVVQRCLEKNKEERFQSARDLAFHLRQLQEAATAGRPRSAPRAVRRRVFVLSAVGVGLLAGVASLLLVPRQRPVPGFEQLTFLRGRIGGARFASEAGAVVYSEAREGRPLEVWWLSGPDSPQSRLLGHRGSDILSVRAGKLALSLGRRFVVGERFTGTLAEAPMGEGSPLELAENVEDADWDPSGAQLAVARSATVGGESLLEYPAGHVLYRTSGSIRYPRFSRDGRWIAILEDPTGRGAGGRVAVVDLEGRLTPLTDHWASASGLAWSSTGDEIWFAAGGWRTNRALRAVDLKRRQRLILQTPASLTLWDIAPDGRVLLARDEERSALVGVPPGESTERDLSWFDTSGLADLSEDGQTLLFDDRFGVYIRRTDGSPPVHLGLKEGFGDDFSPDGKSVLATTASGSQLVVLPAGLGDPMPLPAHGIAAYRGALWFPDGRRVLFNGTLPGGSLRSYVQDLRGGAPSALTPENTWVLSISPDGEWAAAIGPDQGVSLWPVAGGRPRPVPSSQPGDRPVAWSADGRWLWVFHRGEVPAEVSRLEMATGRRELWRTLKPPDSTGVYCINDFKVTRDGRAYFYSYKRVLSQLYMANGLK